MIRSVILDAKTLGDDVSFSSLEAISDLTVWQLSTPEEVSSRIANADVVITNKVHLNENNLKDAPNVRLICVAATGYDNIDIEYCKRNHIAVCNVKGYSTHSVAQLTVAMVLSLALHLPEYNEFVHNGSYSHSGVANQLTPTFGELYGKTWGIIGAGNIGGQVARIAEALGCTILVHRRTQDPHYKTIDLATICSSSDIISLHLPLSDETRGIISREIIRSMKQGVILINVSRGAVTDENAVAEAVLSGHIGGLGCDVYSEEPFSQYHPYFKLLRHPHVCFTPHMAWGALEARQRCLNEIAQNIRCFYLGGLRNRIT